MSQPKWKCVGNLGDKNPVDHGGLLVFVDETGVYPPEVEKIEPPCDGEKRWEVRRVVLDPCTYVNGVLSDNKFHPNHPAWFADDLDSVCSSMDVERDELIRLFCSDEPMERAEAWRCVLDQHGWANVDDYPLHLTRNEIKNRLRGKNIPEVLAR